MRTSWRNSEWLSGQRSLAYWNLLRPAIGSAGRSGANTSEIDVGTGPSPAMAPLPLSTDHRHCRHFNEVFFFAVINCQRTHVLTTKRQSERERKEEVACSGFCHAAIPCPQFSLLSGFGAHTNTRACARVLQVVGVRSKLQSATWDPVHRNH